MKKRNLLLIIGLAVSLSACGGSPENSETEETAVSASAESETTVEETSSEAPTTSSFEEITVVDNEYCTIKLTGLDPDNMWGYTVNAYMENKSPETTYMFSVTNASINGVQCDPFFSTEVAAGKKVNSEINFSDEALEDEGITDFTDIEISFRVYDSNDWSAEDVANATTHVYPYGEENATVYVRQPQDTDIVIADNEYISAVITGFEEDDIWGYTANLYLTNKTDSEVMFSVDNCSINGYMIDPFYASSVAAGKSAFSSMSWSDDELTKNGITDVTDIEFSFRAYNSEDYSADDYFNEIITVNP